MRRVGPHLVPFASSILFWASAPPLDLWPLMWLAPVPLLTYILAAPLSWRRAGVLYLSGSATWALHVTWFSYVAPLGVVLGPLYRGFGWPIFAALARWIGGRPMLVFPALWAVQEYAALYAPLVGFPFYLIGYSQIEMTAFVQIADLGGVLLVGMMVLMFSSLVADAAVRREISRRWKWEALIWLGTFAASVGYGSVRLTRLEVEAGPRILIVQPNIPQEVKELVGRQDSSFIEREERARKVFKEIMDVMRGGLGEAQVVLWPEASVPGVIWESPLGGFESTQALARLFEAARASGTTFLTGCEIGRYDPVTRKATHIYNSALVIEPNGRIQGRYDKVRLVAFGEYVPDMFLWFVRNYSGLRNFANATPGRGFVVWNLGGTPVAPLICFEGLFPDISRTCAGKGARAVVNISNDGWFGSSGELDESLAVARFRSIECRIGFVRATNTGISAVIDPRGMVVAKISGKEVAGTLSAQVPVARGGSVYQVVGDGAALILALVLILGTVAPRSLTAMVPRPS